MEAFDNIALEKKERIINAAMNIFAIYGYRKTSVSDIAKEAKISKAMIFTYFGSKCGCYEYMCNEMLRLSLEEIGKVQAELLAVSDYFDRIILSAKIKIDLLKHCHPLLAFAASVFKERDEEVCQIVNKTLSEAYLIREMFLFKNIDSSKFKNPFETKHIGKITTWLSQGCADEWSRCESGALDSILTDFIDCMKTLKKHFYKEEYI